MRAAERRKAEDGTEDSTEDGCRVHDVGICLRVFVPDGIVSMIEAERTGKFCLCFLWENGSQKMPRWAVFIKENLCGNQ